MVLIGPCMVLAPLVAVVAFLAVPFWPVAIVIVAAIWLVVWPIERVMKLLGVGVMQGWSAKIGRTLYYVIKPWVYLDVRYPNGPRSSAPPPP